MKARIEKKLCKKIVEILPDNFYSHSWADNEVSELAENQNTRVSGVLYIGGGVDYWGEGEDEYTVLYDFAMHFNWHPPIYNPYPDGHKWEGLPMGTKKRLTGQYLIKCAREIANYQENK
jgi:hypothetical protein